MVDRGLTGSCPRDTPISFVVCKNEGLYALTLGSGLTLTSGALSANVTWKYPHQTDPFPEGIYTLFGKYLTGFASPLLIFAWTVVDTVTRETVGLSTNPTVQVKS
jgi:hypothetical protein